jgi:hypothetical protein
MGWRTPVAILAAILLVIGGVQAIAGAHEVAQEHNVAGAIVTSSGCSAMVQTGSAGGVTFPIDTCRTLPAGTQVQVTLDQGNPIAVHLGSLEIYASVDTGAANRDDGINTALAGLALVLLVALVSISTVRRAIRLIWLRIVSF